MSAYWSPVKWVLDAMVASILLTGRTGKDTPANVWDSLFAAERKCSPESGLLSVFSIILRVTVDVRSLSGSCERIAVSLPSRDPVSDEILPVLHRVGPGVDTLAKVDSLIPTINRPYGVRIRTDISLP